MLEILTKEVFGALLVWHVALIAVIVLALVILLVSFLAKRKKSEKAEGVAPEAEVVVEETQTSHHEARVEDAVATKEIEAKAEKTREEVEKAETEAEEIKPEVEEIEPADEPKEVDVNVEAEEELEDVEMDSEEVDTTKIEDEEIEVEAEEKDEKVTEKPIKKAEEKSKKKDEGKEEQSDKEKKPIKAKEPAPKKNVARGKIEISLRSDGYHFSLIANNGQLLYDSFGFASLAGAKGGIETFKKSVKEGSFTVYRDKFDRFRYVLNKRYSGENYNNKASCESSVQSVIRFAENAALVDYVRDPEAEKLFEESKKNVKVITDEEWQVELEKEYKPSGKYELVLEDDGYHFYLSANNGQLLYSSRSYTTEDSAISGINSFKRAVFTGNFYIDVDKFGKYRFIVRGGGNVVHVGESFSTKVSAVNNSKSVQNFAMSAIIVPSSEN